MTTVSANVTGRLDLSGEYVSSPGYTYQAGLLSPVAGNNGWFSLDGKNWMPE